MQEQSEPRAFGKPLWLLWSWWRGDALPICSVVSGLTVEESKHVELLSNLMGFPEAEMREQLWLGHRAYLARLGTLPVAVGWSATGEVALFGPRIAQRDGAQFVGYMGDCVVAPSQVYQMAAFDELSSLSPQVLLQLFR
jgi:hypothetical protein